MRPRRNGLHLGRRPAHDVPRPVRIPRRTVDRALSLALRVLAPITAVQSSGAAPRKRSSRPPTSSPAMGGFATVRCQIARRRVRTFASRLRLTENCVAASAHAPTDRPKLPTNGRLPRATTATERLRLIRNTLKARFQNPALTAKGVTDRRGHSLDACGTAHIRMYDQPCGALRWGFLGPDANEIM